MKSTNSFRDSYLLPLFFLGFLGFFEACPLLTNTATAQARAESKTAQSAEGVFTHDRIEPAPGWPLWLKDYQKRTVTEETSAISFVGVDDLGRRCFFLADDVGRLHFCRVDERDPVLPRLILEDVGFDRSIILDLAANDKWDFEAIGLDFSRRRQGTVADSIDGILSIEGRGPLLEITDTTRLINIRLINEKASDNLAPSWRIESSGDALPGSRFWQSSLASNLGIEGIATSENYLTLGQESLTPRGEYNVHGTVIYLYNKDLNRSSVVRTQPIGIHSITGMAAVNDSVTVVLDRNRQRVTVIRWDIAGAEIRMHSCHHFPLSLPAPGGFSYAIASLEGVAVDERGDIWCVTDPWHDHYQTFSAAAPETLYVYLAAEIPMIYRFSGETIWSAAGLTHLWD